MKPKMHIRNFALFFSMLILLQTCTIYKGKGISLDDAVNENTKSEVVTNYDVTHKFKRVIQEDGNYYGLKKVKGEFEKTTIIPSDIKIVRVKDKTLSTILTILVPIVTLTVIGLVIPPRSPTTINFGPIF